MNDIVVTFLIKELVAAREVVAQARKVYRALNSPRYEDWDLLVRAFVNYDKVVSEIVQETQEKIIDPIEAQRGRRIE